MVAKQAAKVAGTGIGAALGGFFTNPAVLLISALGIGLFIFRDKISEFFSSAISDFEFPEFKFPDFNITLPEFNFPDFEFPEFPSFDFPTLPNLCSLFGIGCDEQTEDFESSEGLLTQGERDLCQCGSSIVQDSSGLVTETCKQCGPPPQMNPDLLDEPSDAELFAKDFPEPFVEPPPPIVVDPALDIPEDVIFEGGGPSFIGGSIGQNPVDTLTEVIDLFPKISASGAANFLFQFSGISPSEAIKLKDFQKFI